MSHRQGVNLVGGFESAGLPESREWADREFHAILAALPREGRCELVASVKHLLAYQVPDLYVSRKESDSFSFYDRNHYSRLDVPSFGFLVTLRQIGVPLTSFLGSLAGFCQAVLDPSFPDPQDQLLDRFGCVSMLVTLGRRAFLFSHVASEAHITSFQFLINGGGSEIRTHDARRHGAFQERWNKPLSDSSLFYFLLTLDCFHRIFSRHETNVNNV